MAKFKRRHRLILSLILSWFGLKNRILGRIIMEVAESLADGRIDQQDLVKALRPLFQKKES